MSLHHLVKLALLLCSPLFPGIIVSHLTDVIHSQSQESVTIRINTSVEYQSMIGFGGAMTDAAGFNIRSLKHGLRKRLLKAYFGDEGIEYKLIRVPIASCDFSMHVYSYDDVRDDFDLNHFGLNKADFEYKIPFIQEALTLAPGARVFGSPWGPPFWMKTTDRMEGPGVLIGEPGGRYYKSWAKYLVKFIEAYHNNSIPIWGLTVENEPSMGLLPHYDFQALGLTGKLERDFISKDLGPALRAAGLEGINLMIFDDNRWSFGSFTSEVLSDTVASYYINGIAVHWYGDDSTNTSIVDKIHSQFPGKFILSTEACYEGTPVLGSWERAEAYALDIIDNLNHHYSGWVDWNMALDKIGGPNWVANYVDSPIIVEPGKHRFHKQPMFYAIGHFSKFIPPGARRVERTVSNGANINSTVWCTAYSCTAVILNRESDSKTIILESGSKEIRFISQSNSIMSVVFGK